MTALAGFSYDTAAELLVRTSGCAILLHTTWPDGACGCDDPGCARPGSHPILRPLLAATDVETLRSLQRAYPEHRVGIFFAFRQADLPAWLLLSRQRDAMRRAGLSEAA